MEISETPQIVEHSQLTLDFTPQFVKWIPNSARFILLGQHNRMKGLMQIQKLHPNKLEKEYEKVFDDCTGLKCATFNVGNDSTRSAAIGDFDGNMFVYDFDKMSVVKRYHKAHKKMINAVDGIGGNIGFGNNEIATGSRDGCVKLFDIREKEPVVELDPAQGEDVPDCWAVALGNSQTKEERTLAAGYDNGDLKIFDLKKNMLLWDTNLKNGICDLEFDRKDCQMNKLVACTLEGKFHVFDMRTNHPESGQAELKCEAPKSTLWCLKHFPQNRDLFAVMAGNGSMNLQKQRQPTKRFEEDEEGLKKGIVGRIEKLNDQLLAQQPIVSVDFHEEKLGLACFAALDQTVKVAIITKLDKQ